MSESSQGSKVVLLTSPGLGQRLLAQRLQDTVGLAALVEEHRPMPLGGKGAGLKKLLARVVGRATVGRLLQLKHRLGEPAIERRVRQLEERLKAEGEKELLGAHGPDPKTWPDVPRLQIPRVNRAEAVEWCRSHRPDVLIVYGTSILKEPMIQVPRLGVLNAHSSVLPHFRGVFSEFWQVFHGDLDHVGVTVHFIDTGVDTGDVVLQRRTSTEAPPAEMSESQVLDPYRLRARNVATTLEIYPEAAAAVLAGRETRQKQPSSDAQVFRSRDLTFERRLELLRRLGYDL